MLYQVQNDSELKTSELRNSRIFINILHEINLIVFSIVSFFIKKKSSEQKERYFIKKVEDSLRLMKDIHRKKLLNKKENKFIEKIYENEITKELKREQENDEVILEIQYTKDDNPIIQKTILQQIILKIKQKIFK